MYQEKPKELDPWKGLINVLKGKDPWLGETVALSKVSCPYCSDEYSMGEFTIGEDESKVEIITCDNCHHKYKIGIYVPPTEV